jgi:hypothetical protein
MNDLIRAFGVILFISFGTSLLADEDSGPLSFPEWSPLFTEFTRTQTSDWLNDDEFAVGRWDGTISVFRRPTSGEFTPVLTDVWRTKDGSGVEMLHSLDENTVLFSDGPTTVSLRTMDGSSGIAP